MRWILTIATTIGFLLVPSTAMAQASSTQVRTEEISALFEKEKHVVKEKNGVKSEKYKKVRSEPMIKQNVREYSGDYEFSDLGYRINIHVGDDGSVKASGSEPAGGGGQTRSFRLEGAKIEGAMLTGTKVYNDGGTEKFEGVFINRTVFDSPTDKGSTVFGLGVVGRQVEVAGLTLDKLFYERKP